MLLPPNEQPKFSQAKYSVILSVLDPRKCEYLKDYSLDFEHACMTTYLASWEACRYFFAALSDRLSKTFSSTRLWIQLAIWKSSTNLWINLMMTSSETAIFSRMEPHATPRMRTWPKSKAFLWPDYFENLMAAKISWLKSARFFLVGRLKRKSLCQQATHHTGTGKQHSTWNCCD